MVFGRIDEAEFLAREGLAARSVTETWDTRRGKFENALMREDEDEDDEVRETRF